MRIRYENTVEDFVAFVRFQNDHSPAVRRARVRAMRLYAVFALVVIIGVALKMYATQEEQGRGDDAWLLPLVWTVLVTGAMLLSLARLPRAFRRQTVRQARRMYAEGANKSVLGPRELELVGDVLVSRSSFAESRMKVEAVERVITDGAYTFVFVSAVTAHIIPHAAVSEGDVERFAEALGRHVAPAHPDSAF